MLLEGLLTVTFNSIALVYVYNLLLHKRNFASTTNVCNRNYLFIITNSVQTLVGHTVLYVPFISQFLNLTR